MTESGLPVERECSEDDMRRVLKNLGIPITCMRQGPELRCCTVTTRVQQNHLHVYMHAYVCVDCRAMSATTLAESDICYQPNSD